jgi:hypothetical protein
VAVPGPKQLQLNSRADVVGAGVAGVDSAINDGTPTFNAGAANCGGAAGGGTGASKGFGAGNCAHTLIRSGGQHSVIMKPTAIAAAAASFRIRNLTLPLDSPVTILESVSAFGYNRADDTLQVRPHFASVRGPTDCGLLPACLR